jgi:phosphoribosylanthranilate isomerase
VFIKIEGTTSEEDALLAVALGADALGFVFAPSPRQLAPQIAADIVKRLPAEILTVGVFRDEAPQRVVQIAKAAGMKAVQLHGSESPEETRWIRERVPIVIKAFVAGGKSVANADAYGADIVLLDAENPGSGEVFDWRMTDGVPEGTRVMLAGGLTPENVAEAIGMVAPWGVDVATGVESSPGHKDPRKLRMFIAAARAAAPKEYESPGDDPFDWADEG